MATERLFPRIVVVLLVVTAACTSADTGAASGATRQTERITVFAAASLTDAFMSAAELVPQVRPRFSFGGSQQLVTQLLQGARADVVATADDVSMQRLVDAELVEPPLAFARTRLVIAVRAGNPSGITGLADLGRPGITVVLADPSVPAGRYARKVLDGASVRVTPRSFELDVRAALAKVSAGEADAALVYATDLRSSSGKAEPVEFAEASEPSAAVDYRIAVVRGTRHRPAAEAYAASASGGRVHESLRAAGFTAGRPTA